MATNWTQGDLVGFRIDLKHFWSGKTIGISSLDKNPFLHIPAEGFEPMMTSQSLSGGVTVTPRLVCHLNHSATEDWFKKF